MEGVFRMPLDEMGPDDRLLPAEPAASLGAVPGLGLRFSS